MTNIVPLIKLSNGYTVPSIGMGTLAVKGDAVERQISASIDAGYRHFDTAMIYRNEADIGAAFSKKLTETGLKREEFFIATKLWGTSHHPDDVRPACEESLRNLQLTYLDLYYIHWPVPLIAETDTRPKFTLEDTWKAMEDLVDAGLVRSIALSNFNKSQIDRIMAVARIRPAMLQIEVSLSYMNRKLVDYAQSIGLTVAAYAPLGAPGTETSYDNLMELQCVKDIAAAHNKSPGQILLRHAVQRGCVALPKSANPQRMAHNLQVFDFELTPQEMETLGNAVPNQVRRFGLNSWSHLPGYPFADEF